MRRSCTYSYNLHDTLAVWVAEVIHSHECVLLPDESFRSCSRYRRGEVGEFHPVQTLVTIFEASAACIRNKQLIVFGYVVVIAAVRHTVKLLHHDDVILTERIVKLAILRIEIHLTRFRVVVVNLHHAGEDTVVVFAQELRDNHLIDTERATYNNVIKLSRPLILLYSSRIEDRFIIDTPTLTRQEIRNKLFTEEIAIKGRITLNVQLLDGCRSPRQQFVHTQLVFAGIIFSGNHKTLLLVFIRTIRSNCMSNDITLRIKAEIIRSIKYEFVAHLCLGESQQLIDIQLIFSGLRTDLYDRKALVLCFIRIFRCYGMGDDVTISIKPEIILQCQ